MTSTNTVEDLEQPPPSPKGWWILFGCCIAISATFNLWQVLQPTVQIGGDYVAGRALDDGLTVIMGVIVALVPLGLSGALSHAVVTDVYGQWGKGTILAIFLGAMLLSILEQSKLLLRVLPEPLNYAIPIMLDATALLALTAATRRHHQRAEWAKRRQEEDAKDQLRAQLVPAVRAELERDMAPQIEAAIRRDTIEELAGVIRGDIPAEKAGDIGPLREAVEGCVIAGVRQVLQGNIPPVLEDDVAAFRNSVRREVQAEEGAKVAALVASARAEAAQQFQANLNRAQLAAAEAKQAEVTAAMEAECAARVARERAALAREYETKISRAREEAASAARARAIAEKDAELAAKLAQERAAMVRKFEEERAALVRKFEEELDEARREAAAAAQAELLARQAAERKNGAGKAATKGKGVGRRSDAVRQEETQEEKLARFRALLEQKKPDGSRLTNEELAEAMRVSVRTVIRWKKELDGQNPGDDGEVAEVRVLRAV